jgi:serine/threonine protein kinase
MFEIGTAHDGWFVDAQLGVGGMGAVYRCHKVSLPEVVAAIKVVLHTDRDAKERFRREAAALNQLSHENVVRFRDVQCAEEPWYIVMDLAQGRPLRELIHGQALPLHRTLSLGLQLAHAVSHVHSRGLRHRDIKPANVIVGDDDRLVLVDFGIAVRPDDPRLTTHGRCGSPSYAPPEWRKADVDEEAWDVYSLGQVLHEMCTGQEAFAAELIDEVMYLKRRTPCLDPGEAVPAALRELVRSCTSLEPEARPRMPTVLQTLQSLSTPTLPPPDPETLGGTQRVAEPGSTAETVLHAPPQAQPEARPEVRPEDKPRRGPLGVLGAVAGGILVLIWACFGFG